MGQSFLYFLKNFLLNFNTFSNLNQFAFTKRAIDAKKVIIAMFDRFRLRPPYPHPLQKSRISRCFYAQIIHIHILFHSKTKEKGTYRAILNIYDFHTCKTNFSHKPYLRLTRRARVSFFLNASHKTIHFIDDSPLFWNK